MSGFSSCCRCGPGGRPKHEMNKCPHLFHICTTACGPYYSKFIGMGPVDLMKARDEGQAVSTSGTTTGRWSSTVPTVSNPPRYVVSGERRIKPPWEK